MTRVAGRGRWVLPAVAAALTAVLIAGTVVLVLAWLDLRDHDDRESARRDAVAAASRAVPAFASFAYTTVAADQARGRAVLTPAFAKRYDSLFANLIGTLQQRKASVVTTVQAAAATDVSSDGRTVAVLTFFQQRSKFGDGAPDKVAQEQYLVEMVEQGGRWLIDDAKAVQ